MSYLGNLRLHFSGRFQADPSTVNNDPEHFDDAAFQANYQIRGPGATNGWWNPRGTGAWRFLDTYVRSVVYRDGTACFDPLADPVVGMAINDSLDRVEGKLVDLDPEQQMVSEIWGFQILLGRGDGPNSFRSHFNVAAFSDIWFRFPAGVPDSLFGAVYQSVLDVVHWSKVIDSRFLSELGRASRLSIKFNVDGIDDAPNSPTFTLGRVVGTIGEYHEGEAQHFVNARVLRPPRPVPAGGYGPTVNLAPARLDGNTLFVDLGNSMPTTGPGGPLADLGPVQLAILPAGSPPVLLGAVPYLIADWYETRAGIHQVRLTDEQAALAQNAPLGLVQTTSERGGAVTNIVITECPDGAMVRADTYVFRIDANTSDTATFYATRFGKPVAATLKLKFDNTNVDSQVTQGPLPGPNAGTPESALTFPSSVTTDATTGAATITLQAGAPPNPRGYIDGQVYGIAYRWEGSDDAVYGTPPCNILNPLVWNAYTWSDPPTWLNNVQPIFQQYANLYPIMKPIVDLSDYSSVKSRLNLLDIVFNVPPSDPNYMPVTRDLSGPKRKMLQQWLKKPLYLSIGTLEELRGALQLAIELEHATIPAYLTSLYSIKDGANTEVASIIRSIVIEEMLHMALACNILNAIDGQPQIARKGFVPAYPGPLPSGLRPGLVVTLEKCSIEHIRNVFMSIEEPETTIDPIARHGETIGWFYEEIDHAIDTLNAQGNIFTGDPARQLRGWPSGGNLFAVTDAATAHAAIQEIVEQGEGASPIDPDDEQRALAHYYKFAEIVNGRKLVRHPGGYTYTGDPIPFDPAGVWPMMNNPSTAALPPGLARLRSDLFNRTYQDLLNSLHRVFNGHPEDLDAAIGVMYSLDLAARQLMETPNGLPGEEAAGPSFEQV